MKTIRPAITLFEYEKILRVLHAVEGYVGRGSRPDCQFYNVVGSYILSEVYKIDAFPMVGAALIKVNNSNDPILGFADTESEFIQSDLDHFHCWIETPEHYIDFTSAFYSDYPGAPKSEKNKMFQKPRQDMSHSPEHIKKAGDFFLLPNLELTKQQLPKYTQSHSFQDAMAVARYWVEVSKKKLQKSIGVQTEDGNTVELSISKIELVGAW